MPTLRAFRLTAAKIVLAITFIGASAALAKFVLFPAIDALVPLPDSASTLLARGLGLLSVVAPYWAFSRLYERRQATDLAPKPGGIAAGFLAGAIMIGAPILGLYALGNYQIVAYRGFGHAIGIAGSILAFAVAEEVVFRGVLFRLVEERAGTLPALLLVSTAFGALHLTNSGVGLTTVLSVTLYGMMWSGIYALSRNLWVVSFHHCAWNFTIFATGLPLSGRHEWREFAPFESTMKGPTILTGGAFGPEDSIFAIGIGLLGFAAVFALARRRRTLVRGGVAPATPVDRVPPEGDEGSNAARPASNTDIRSGSSGRGS